MKIINAASAVDVYKVYGREDTAVTALGGVSVSFATGRFSAIMGPSGSGKSTLLHLCRRAGRRASTSCRPSPTSSWRHRAR